MFNLFKKKAPLVFVVKSDEVNDALLEKIKLQLQPAFPNSRVAVVCISKEEDMYAITG